jgi:subtilisin family serine protease
MNRRLVLALVAGLLSVAAPGVKALDYSNGVIARFAPHMSVADIQHIVGPGVTAELLVPDSGIYLLKDSNKSTGTFLAQRLNKAIGVVYTQPNHPMTLRSANKPNDPRYTELWSLKNGQKPNADIHAEDAWTLGTGGKDRAGRDIVVAVIDGGIDYTHEDLVDNHWVNTKEIAGNGIDDDGNGYVDDVNGWDSTSNSGNVNTGASHGTHVSGIVGAKGDNGKDGVGINWNVKIMTVSVGGFSSADVLKAYGYALANKKLWLQTNGAKGANVVATNSSFGYDYAKCDTGEYPAWNDMYNQLGQAGILSAAATINSSVDVDVEGDVPTGCGSDYLVTVTNTTKDDVKYSSAGYGKTQIDLGAPGTDILSTVPGNGMRTMTGTSMASPHVAGSIGFLYSVASNDFLELVDKDPAKAALEVKRVLLGTTDALPSLQGVTVSGGRLNLAHAARAMSLYSTAPTRDLLNPIVEGIQQGILDALSGAVDQI